jgi:small-conductance mechanosensitive channel/CRP-like cAMP-binding protein
MSFNGFNDYLGVLLGVLLYACFAWLLVPLRRRLGLVRSLRLPLHLLALAWAFWLALRMGPPQMHALMAPYSQALFIYAFVVLAIHLFDALAVGYILVAHKKLHIPSILRHMFLVATYFITALVVLRAKLELDVTSLVATSAVLSFVLGMASQDILGSLLSGLVLGLERPINPGDWVEVDGKEGRVVDVTWRRCQIVTRNGDFVLVPNNHVTSKTIVNYTKPTELHRITIPVGVDYRHPPSEVKDILAQAAARCPRVVADPAPSVYLWSFGDSSITYRVNAWTNDYGAFQEVLSDIQTNIWYALGRAGIEMPYPIRTLQWAPAPAPAPTGERQRAALLPILRQVAFLGELPGAALEWVAEQSRLTLYGQGEIVFREGETGDTYYLVNTGQVRVLKDFGEGEQLLTTLGPGHGFGEMSLLLGQTRNATIKVDQDAELLEISAPVFRRLLEEHPEFLESISRLVEERDRDNAQLQALLAGSEEKGEEGRVRFIMRHIQAALGLKPE